MEEYKKIKYKLSNYNFTNIKNMKGYDLLNNEKNINTLKNKINNINKKIKSLREELEEIGDIIDIEMKYINNKNKQIQKYNDKINLLIKKIWFDTSIDYNKFSDKK